MTPPIKRLEQPATRDSVVATQSASATPEAQVTKFMDILPSNLPTLRGNPICYPEDLGSLRVRLLEDEEDSDLESCFRNPSTKEKTTDEDISMSNLYQVSDTAPIRTAVNATENTGKYPVATTTANSIAVAVAA